MAEFNTKKTSMTTRYAYDGKNLETANCIGKVDIESKKIVAAANGYNKAVSWGGKKNVALKSMNCAPKPKQLKLNDGQTVFYFEHGLK